MNRPDKETLRRVIHKMHKQNDCEKFTELASVFTGMRGKLNPHSVEFSSDNLHILGIHERGHILIPIEEQLNLPELFYWTCYSWWNLLRIKRTGKQQSEDFTD